MSETPTTTENPPKAKSPVKKRHEAIVYAFGQPLESFETANKPTDLDIIRHWMYLEDQKTKSNSTSNSVNIAAKNLVEFYTKYHSSVELR